MAAFGLRSTEVEAETPSGDPAERALHTALALQRTARQALQTILGLTALPLDIALGLGTGTIVLSRARGSLLGPAAEAAAWLAEQAEADPAFARIHASFATAKARALAWSRVSLGAFLDARDPST